MKIIPLGFDSLGVRSMATLVETSDHRIVIDPGAALSRFRFGLPPNIREMNKLEEITKKINDIAETASIITVSHYHNDHYEPNSNFYSKKIVLVKDPKKNINRGQMIEYAPFFITRVRNMTDKLKIADGKLFEFGETKIYFSPAVPHGRERARQGFVIMVAVSDGDETVVHTSDIQGPIVKTTAKWIIAQKPDFIILDGPPIYHLGERLSEQQLEVIKENINQILTRTDAKIIFDHHLTRDDKYREKLGDIWDEKRTVTAAEYLGVKELLLEAWRKNLWEEDFVNEKTRNQESEEK